MKTKKNTTDWSKVNAAILATDKEILKKVIAECDGWSIFAPHLFTKLGLAKEIVKAYTQTHVSGDHPKERIYSGNDAVPKLKGVYGLELLEGIASAFHVRSDKNGRGFRAQELTSKLNQLWAAPITHFTGVCKHCSCQLHWDGKVWTDNTGGDVCGWNGGNEPHVG